VTVLSFWRRGHRDEPRDVPDTPAPPPREAFVLAGGGSLGAAQVGTLQALLAAGITPDLLVGCSAGAYNAAYLAIDPTYDRTLQLEQVWRRMSRKQFFPDSRATVMQRLLRRTDHIYSPRGLRQALTETIPIDDLADTAVPVHVVTTDLLAGEPRYWSAGNAHDVLMASACLPGLFPPVVLDGSPQVDGGVLVPAPIQRALDLGAQRVWVLEHNRQWHGIAGGSVSALDILLESFAISRAALGRRPPVAAPGQRVVYVPDLDIGRHDMRDFSKTSMLLAAGREAGRAMIETERRAVLARRAG
jgi:predicted acylesterase/phospholipase RssA